MNKWFYFNCAVLLLAIWKVINSSLHSYVIFGLIGLFFILFNWTRHAVFSTLRSSMDRRKKIKFANLSKRILPFHKWIGTSALFLIGIHATLAIQRFGFHMQNTKITSGLITGIILTIVVITGWMRLFRPSAKKRMAHLYLGLTMFFFIIVHLIL